MDFIWERQRGDALVWDVALSGIILDCLQQFCTKCLQETQKVNKGAYTCVLLGPF